VGRTTEVEGSLTLSGTKTVRGVAKTVTVDLTAKRSGATIQVNGTVPVAFADYGIPSPSFGPAGVEDHGEIEFLVTFTRAADGEER
jgi:hypothetical protein